MIFTFRFFNHRKVLVVARDLDSAMEALDDSQKADIKGFTTRKCVVKL
mgnify:CR=1 FL=1